MSPTAPGALEPRRRAQFSLEFLFLSWSFSHLVVHWGWWPESRVLLQPRARTVLTRAWPVSPCPCRTQPRSRNPFFLPFPLPPFCSLPNCLSCPVSLPFSCPCVLVPTHKGSSSVGDSARKTRAASSPAAPFSRSLTRSLTHSPAFYPKL